MESGRALDLADVTLVKLDAKVATRILVNAGEREVRMTADSTADAARWLAELRKHTPNANCRASG